MIFAFSAATSLNITCHYIGYDLNNWGDRYTCSAKLEDATKPGIVITNVIDEHNRLNTNEKVRGVDLQNQKTFYILRGLTQFAILTDVYVFRADLNAQ